MYFLRPLVFETSLATKLKIERARHVQDHDPHRDHHGPRRECRTPYSLYKYLVDTFSFLSITKKALSF